MGYVNFNVDEECVDTILNIAQDVYGIEGIVYTTSEPSLFSSTVSFLSLSRS